MLGSRQGKSRGKRAIGTLSSYFNGASAAEFLRGEAGAGVPGASCAMCHTESNFTLHEAATYQSIPGHPRWQLAPLSMSWEGKTLGDICRQLKDTNRNGGRDLAALQEHIAKDDLVAWG
jgi:hypothetical protein